MSSYPNPAPYDDDRMINDAAHHHVLHYDTAASNIVATSVVSYW